jgi:hypothetical protein
MRRPLVLTLVAVALLLGASTAFAAECWEVCNPSVPCDTECGYDPGKGGPVTCGEQGLACDDGGACYPSYQLAGTTALGAFAVYYYSPVSCDHVVLYQNTYHDVNNCPGSSDYTTCFYWTNASRQDHLCCYYYYCGGQTTC